jgi:hypothetical protein
MKKWGGQDPGRTLLKPLGMLDKNLPMDRKAIIPLAR